MSPTPNFLKANTYNLKVAFTLIELLVVIAIIGLLSSIVLASLSNARAKAADAAIIEDLIGIRTSAEVYLSENPVGYGKFPSSGVFPEQSCPISAQTPPPSFIYSSTIAPLFQNIRTFSGATTLTLRCGSTEKNYAVMAELKTLAIKIIDLPIQPTCKKYYCVDSNGKSTLVQKLNPSDVIIGLSNTSFSCSTNSTCSLQ